MVNWTHHGAQLEYSTFGWAQGDAWASQAIPRDGKFYWYVTATERGGRRSIGVAVADTPTGRFGMPSANP